MRPQLVIWQVGANAAIRDVDPAIFRATIVAGVKRLQEAGIDIILMDNQRAQRILDAAAATGVALFSRGALIDAWLAEGHHYERFIAADGLHHNDLGYRCLGEAVAKAIVAATQRP